MLNNIEIVLFNPEIPQNTGNIMRTCVALGIKLHLIEPLGFKIDDKKLKRSALDYYEFINFELHKSFADFKKLNDGKYYFLTRYANKKYSEIKFNESKTHQKIFLCFGSESYGIKRRLLSLNFKDCFRIPTTDKVRSLNLSNCVAIVLFEAARQLDFNGLIDFEPESLKGKDFLSKYNYDDNEK